MNSSALISQLISSLSKRGKLPLSLTIHSEDRAITTKGESELFLDIYIKNRSGLKALMSLNELSIVEAYLKGALEIEGNLIEAMSFQELLSDRNPWLKLWRRLKPLLLGRPKCNPDWISQHYDANNLQFWAIDTEYKIYTPGIYEKDEDSLEVGAERKLEKAFQSLHLQPNDSVLDIGCGWGGFLTYAARRNVRVTGITLSKHQQKYVEDLIENNNFNAQVMYQDFFSFPPSEKYDGIVMMGVMEDLSDYHLVMQRLPNFLKPGGRVYLDFASEKEPFATRSFITKYIWPGTFRMVYLPEFIEAVKDSLLEIEAIYNDRHNYYLWAKGMYDRWMKNKTEVVQQSSDFIWRMFRILYAGTSGAMCKPYYYVTAYRVILELPEDRNIHI